MKQTLGVSGVLWKAVLLLGAAGSVYQIPFDEAYEHGLGKLSVHPAHSGFNAPVSVKIIVDPQGNVESARAVDGPRGAFREAELAEKHAKFKPFLRNGKPVRASFTDTVSVYPLERWAEPRVPFPTIRNWSTVRLRMERRAYCFEPRCMADVVEVRADGTAELRQGEFAFRNPQHSTGRISLENYKLLIDEFRRANFFSMLNLYVEEMTDGQGALLSFSFDGQEKAVSDYCGVLAGAPDALRHLEDRFVELTKTIDWKQSR